MRTRRTASVLAVGIVGAGMCLAGCSSSSSPGSSGATALPSSAKLQSALLTAGQLGPSYTVTSSGASSGSSPSGNSSGGPGCSALEDAVTNNPADSNAPKAEVDLSSGQAGPFVVEGLKALSASTLDTRYSQAQAALATCHSLAVDGQQFTLSPANLGSGLAVKLTGTAEGLPFEGYIVLDKVTSDVGLSFEYIWVPGAGSGSLQEAKKFYQQAVTAAQGSL